MVEATITDKVTAITNISKTNKKDITVFVKAATETSVATVNNTKKAALSAQKAQTYIDKLGEQISAISVRAAKQNALQVEMLTAKSALQMNNSKLQGQVTNIVTKYKTLEAQLNALTLVDLNKISDPSVYTLYNSSTMQDIARSFCLWAIIYEVFNLTTSSIGDGFGSLKKGFGAFTSSDGTTYSLAELRSMFGSTADQYLSSYYGTPLIIQILQLYVPLSAKLINSYVCISDMTSVSYNKYSYLDKEGTLSYLSQNTCDDNDYALLEGIFKSNVIQPPSTAPASVKAYVNKEVTEVKRVNASDGVSSAHPTSKLVADVCMAGTPLPELLAVSASLPWVNKTSEGFKVLDDRSWIWWLVGIVLLIIVIIVIICVIKRT